MPDHFESCRHILQHLRHIFTELAANCRRTPGKPLSGVRAFLLHAADVPAKDAVLGLRVAAAKTAAAAGGSVSSVRSRLSPLLISSSSSCNSSCSIWRCTLLRLSAKLQRRNRAMINSQPLDLRIMRTRSARAAEHHVRFQSPQHPVFQIRQRRRRSYPNYAMLYSADQHRKTFCYTLVLALKPPSLASRCAPVVANRCLPATSITALASAIPSRSRLSAKRISRAPTAWQTDTARRHPTTALNESRHAGPRNTNTCPANGSCSSTVCARAQPVKPRRRSVIPAAIQMRAPAGGESSGQAPNNSPNRAVSIAPSIRRRPLSQTQR